MASEYIAAQAGVLMVPTLKGFQSRLNAQLATVKPKAIEVPLEAKGTAKLLAEVEAAKEAAEARPIALKVTTIGVTKALTEIRHKYDDLRTKFQKGLMLNLKIAGLQLLPQAAYAFAALNESIVSVAQSALLLPGILAGVASSMASVVVGTRGVSDAFKAYSSAQKDSVDAARRQRDANRTVMDSTRDLARAVKDAKRNIEDLNDQLRDAPLDEAEAMLNLQEAQAEAAARFGKSQFQQQRDALSVMKAEGQLADTRKRNLRLVDDTNEANAKGVQGSDQVVAATDRLSKALEDAGKGSSAANELAQALAKLSPQANDFFQKVVGLKGAWDGMRGAVQDRLFEGLGDDVVKLAGTGIPLLQKGLGDIAGAINGDLKAAIDSLGSGSNQSLLDRIFGNTASGQQRFSNAIDPLLSGLLKLTAVSSDRLPQLGTAMGAVSARFETFINKADADGSLDRWIDNGIQALKDFGNSMLNIGSILNSVSEAFSGTGGKGLLSQLDSGTERLAKFLKGAEGQQKLRQFFYDARAELQQWAPLLRNLPGIIENVSAAGQEWAKLILPFLQEASRLLSEHPTLVKTILYTYLTWKTISPVVSGVKTAIESMGDAVGWVKKALAGESGLVNWLGKFSGLIAVGGPIVLGAGAVAAILLGRYLTAQQEAGEKTAYHADMVARLRGEMDDLSGSLTQNGLIEKLQALGGYKDNNRPDGKTVDLPGLAEKELGLSREKLAQALTPTNQAARNEVTAQNREIIASEIGNSEFLKDPKYQKVMEQTGVTNDDIVAALAGDQGAVSKIDAAKLPFTLSDVLYGYDDPIPDALGGHDKAGLSVRGQTAANVNKAILDDTNHALDVGRDNRATNEAARGKAALNPAGQAMFGQFGSPYAAFEGNGGAAVRIDTPLDKLPKQFVEDVQANGGSIEELAGASIIHMLPSRASMYVTPAAANGMLVGPGTGRSDSILARVSNNEFITRAASVAKYGRGLFHALNAGTVDPDSLPRFDGGGSVSPTPFNPFNILNQPVRPAPSLSTDTISKVHGDWPGPAKSLSPDTISKVHGEWPTRPASAAGPAPGPFASPSWVDSILAGSAPAPIALPDATNPALYDPATGTYSGSPNLKPGVDGDKGSGGGPNVPPTDPHSPTYTPHAGSGASPGAGNEVPHYLTGETPGPGNAGNYGLPTPAALTSAASGAQSATGAAGNPLGFLQAIPDNLQPQNILANIGEILMEFVLSFFGIEPYYFNLGKQLFTGVAGQVGENLPGNPGVQKILDSYGNPVADAGGLPGQANAARQSSYVGPLSSGAQRAAAMAESMAGKPYVWGGGGLDGTDCSGLVMYAIDAYNGKPFSGRTGGTGGFAQSLPAKGGVIISDPSQAPPGTLRVGWNASHTAGTLPDGRNFESSTFGQPIRVGAGASGYNDGQFTNWAYFPAGSFANGGLLSGAGTGRSDSMLARVSNNEFITRASSVAKYGRGLFHALNEGKIDPGSLPGFADGDQVVVPPAPQPAPAPAPPPTPLPAPAQAPTDPAAQQSQAPTDTAQQTVGDAIGGLGSVLGGSGVGSSGALPGAEAPEGATSDVDPRAVMGAAPTNTDHNNPALSKGIKGAWSHVGSLISTAASAAASAGTGGAGGAAGGAAGAGIGAAAEMGGAAVNAGLNVLSSFLVGTATSGTTQGAYGAPVLPKAAPQSQGGPRIVNNYGDIHTASYEQFYKGQQRREAQQQAPTLPMR